MAADRNCDKCVYHTSGLCSRWICEGTKTIDGVKRDVLKELAEKMPYNTEAKIKIAQMLGGLEE